MKNLGAYFKKDSFSLNESVNPIHIDEDYPFAITNYGFSYPDPKYSHFRSNSRVTVIEYVISGSGIINVDDNTYVVNAGDTYLLPMKTKQYYYSSSENPLEKIWFNCTGPLAHELLTVYNIHDCIIFKNLYLYPYIEKMHRLMQSSITPSYAYDEAAVLFHQIIQILAKHQHMLSEDKSFVHSIKKYIDLHISENIKISDISEHVSYSPDHIIRIFKDKYGITPHQYIINSKMNLACSMLLCTTKSIKEISETLNYNEVHHFSKLFEKVIGVRPSIYRKEVKLNMNK